MVKGKYLLIAGIMAACLVFAGAASALAVQITVVSHGCGQTEATRTLLDEFEAAYPDIEVDLVSIPFQQFKQKVSLDLASGEGAYDVLLAAVAYMSDWQHSGLLQPLDEYLQPDRFKELTGYTLDEYDWDDVHDAYKNTGVIDGKRYTLTWRGDTKVLFYRKDLLTDPKEKAAFKAEYGYEIPDLTLPNTLSWSQLRDVAEFFTRPEDNLYGFALTRTMRPAVADDVFVEMLWAMGGQLFDRETLRFDGYLNSKAAVGALEMMNDLMQFAPPGAENVECFETATWFAQGNLVFVTNWPFQGSMLADPNQTVLTPDQFGATVVPYGEKRKSFGYCGWYYTISNLSKNKEAAFIFSAWMSRKENELKIIRQAGVPTRISVMKDPVLAEMNPAIPVLPYALDNAEIRPEFYIPIMARIYEDIATAITTALFQGQDYQEALDDCVERVEKIMERSGFYE